MASLCNPDAQSRLLSLPTELLELILSYIFHARTLSFDNSNTQPLAKVDLSIQRWPVHILQTSSQLNGLAKSALNSAIAKSTLFLSGTIPDQINSSALLSDTGQALLHNHKQLHSLLSQHTSLIHRVYFKSLTSTAPIDRTLSYLPNVREVHFDHHYGDLQLIRDDQGFYHSEQSNFSTLARDGSDAEIKAASLAYWKNLQAWYKRYPSWYTLSTTGTFGNSSFWDFLKTPKGGATDRRNFDVFLHVEYGPLPLPETSRQNTLMDVTWKFADAPFEGDGMEVLKIERNWERIRRFYDNAYGHMESFGVAM